MKRPILVFALLLLLAVAGHGTAFAENSSEAPLSYPLSVHVKPMHSGAFLRYPGFTALEINGEPYWHQTAVVRVKGKAIRPIEPDKGSTADEWVEYAWSCKRPGIVYAWVVTVTGPTGQTETESGHFTGASLWWCKHGWRAASQAEIRKLDHQSEREERERETRERREVEAVERYERNCRAIGGEVGHIETSAGSQVVCHSKTGGIIPVPN